VLDARHGRGISKKGQGGSLQNLWVEESFLSLCEGSRKGEAKVVFAKERGGREGRLSVDGGVGQKTSPLHLGKNKGALFCSGRKDGREKRREGNFRRAGTKRSLSWGKQAASGPSQKKRERGFKKKDARESFAGTTKGEISRSRNKGEGESGGAEGLRYRQASEGRIPFYVR